MAVETTISTPLPAGVQPSVVVALLHNHEIYIRITCPQLISYSRISPSTLLSPSSPSSSSSSSPSSDDSSNSNSNSNSNPNVAPVDEPHTFEVTDRRPTGQTTYRLTLTNRAEGIDSAVDGKAPTGSMAIRARWRVSVTGGDAGLLEEHVDIESNMITKKMVKSNIERSHPAYHRTFLAEAAKAS